GNRSIDVSGELGTWQALVAGENIEYSLSGRLDRFSLQSTGFIDNFVTPHRPSLTFSAAGPDINELFELARIDAVAEGDVRIDGSLTATGTEPLLLRLKGNVGQLEIDASGSFSDLQDFENIDLEVAASGPDLANVLRLFDIHGIGEAPFVIDLDAERRGSRMTVERARMEFADAVFSAAAEIPRFPDLHDADIELSIVGPDVAHFRKMLNLPGTATGAFSLLAELETRDDGIEIAFLRAETSLGRLEAEGVLGEEPRLVGTEVRFTLQCPSLAALAGGYGLPRLPDAPVEISGKATLEADGVRTHGPLVAKVDDITVTIDGLMRGVRGLYGSRLDYGIEGPDLAQLVGVFADSSWVPAERYAFRGVLDIGEDGFDFRNVAGTLGDSNIAVNGLLRPISGIAGSKFTFTANGPEIGVLIPGAVDLEIRPGPYELSGALAVGADSLRLENIRLERELGKATVNLEIGTAERRLKFAMNADGRDIRSVLSRIEGIEPNEAPFSLNAAGELLGKRLALDKLDIVIGDASLTASGDLDLTESAQSTRFHFEIDIASLARLGTFWGYQMRPQALHVNAAVVGEGGVLSLTDATARLDDSDIVGAIRYETGDTPELRVDIVSESLLLASPLEEREAPDDPTPTFDDGRVIPDTAVPIEALAKINATVNLEVGNLIRVDKHYRNVELGIKLTNGTLELSRLGFDAPSGRLDARARLAPSADTAVVQLEIAATDLAFGFAESNRDLSMTGEFQVNLNSTGSTLRELADNADGVVLIDTRGGRGTSSPALQRLYGDMLGEILAVINPFYKADPYTSFRCIVVPLQVDKGRLVTKPNALILTDKVQIVTTGQIDFASEALELTFRTTPRKGVVISAGEILNPFVKV
ncbi:MAG: AsmA family protein, partial [Gammaproteobacteria bacterium]|nr:AsmA family protein [Gammaproteobacteria bacterium]